MGYFWIGVAGLSLLCGIVAIWVRREIFAIGTALLGSFGVAMCVRSVLVLTQMHTDLSWTMSTVAESLVFGWTALVGWLFQVFFMRRRIKLKSKQQQEEEARTYESAWSRLKLDKYEEFGGKKHSPGGRRW